MPTERTVYLEDIPLDEAQARLQAALVEVGRWQALPGEYVPLGEALGRVTAEAVWAAISAPHYHASAMDGYALRSADSQGATETAPLTLHLVDDESDIERVARPAQAVNTGNAMPHWADAVIMIEHTQLIEIEGEQNIEIRAPTAPWKNVRPMGEDMVASELVLPANHTLRPVDIGAIASSGHHHVKVRRKPQVTVIPTGSELVPIGEATNLRPGDIIESNSLLLAAQIESWGGKATRWPIVPDQFDAINESVAAATQSCDLLLVNAGSSAGSEDYTAQVIRQLGTLLVHGVAVRPGHPVIFGIVNDTLVIGVPGYPVSAALTGQIFIEPLLAQWLGRRAHQAPVMQATISRKVQSPTGDDEFMRVTVGQVGQHTIATPLSRGAGVISSLVRADGIVRIPRFSEGLDAGQTITVELYRHPSDIANTIVALGSHDMTLDLLAQFLAEARPHRRLASANLGSIGGLLALKREQAHLAGVHLLDTATGRFNRSYVNQYLPGRDILLVTLVGRTQGLMVSKGNPKNILTISDLARDDVRFVNRQRGSGTRLLLDYHLDQSTIAPKLVTGYDREEYSHLAVAAAVASNVADCGLGVMAAARALDLDFVPLAEERYDLAIPRAYYQSALLQPLLNLLHDQTFRATVASLPGYDVRSMGNVEEA